MTCADGLSLAWPQRTCATKRQDNIKTRELVWMGELSFPAGCRLSGPLALSLCLQPHSGLTEVILRSRGNYANSNQRTDICDAMSNYTKRRLKKVAPVFHASNSPCFSFLPLSLAVGPLPLDLSLPPLIGALFSPPAIPPSISPSFSLAPSDMSRVGYPDKARLYKHSSTTGRTHSPERGISPQSSHTNA